MTHQPYLHEALNLEAMLRHEREHGIVLIIEPQKDIDSSISIKTKDKNRGPTIKRGKSKSRKY